MRDFAMKISPRYRADPVMEHLAIERVAEAIAPNVVHELQVAASLKTCGLRIIFTSTFGQVDGEGGAVVFC